jgi:putative transposase
MPRQPRLVIPEYPHHIILRGNNRSDIFYNDKDRFFFLDCLKEAKEKTSSKIYSYCLMTNHLHIIIEPEKQEGLQVLMQSLGRRYVQYFNYTHSRTGTLWEGRYKSSVIDKDNYLFACSRYIELNPVRAKMVKHPKEYPWSSYRHKAEGILNKLIDHDPAYAGLGKTDRERQFNYRQFFLEEVPESEIKLIRFCTQKGGIIGSKSFVDRMAKKAGRKLMVRPRGRPRKSL